MTAARRLLALAGAAIVLAACGQEIDSQPAVRAETPARRTAAPPPAAVGPTAAGVVETPAGDVDASDADAGTVTGERYRTNLYSEHDTDVHAMLDDNTSLGSSGTVKALRAELGDRVRAGQVLAVLDDARPTLAVQAAQAHADEIRGQLDRTSQLLEKGFTTVAEHERLTHALAEATADLEQARLDLARTRVLAPFAGVVARRYVRLGERIDEATPLFRITAMSPLRARVMVPEAQIGALRRGSPVTLTASNGARAEALVVLVGPTVDPSSGTREVVVEVPGGEGFLPGAEVVAEAVVAADDGPARESAGPTVEANP